MSLSIPKFRKVYRFLHFHQYILHQNILKVNWDPVQKRIRFLHFFYVFFSKSRILWNLVAYIKKKKLRVRNRLNFYLQKKKQVYWIIIWRIFIAWKNAIKFCVANFYGIISQGNCKRCGEANNLIFNMLILQTWYLDMLWKICGQM